MAWLAPGRRLLWRRLPWPLAVRLEPTPRGERHAVGARFHWRSPHVSNQLPGLRPEKAKKECRPPCQRWRRRRHQPPQPKPLAILGSWQPSSIQVSILSGRPQRTPLAPEPRSPVQSLIRRSPVPVHRLTRLHRLTRQLLMSSLHRRWTRRWSPLPLPSPPLSLRSTSWRPPSSLRGPSSAPPVGLRGSNPRAWPFAARDQPVPRPHRRNDSSPRYPGIHRGRGIPCWSGPVHGQARRHGYSVAKAASV